MIVYFEATAVLFGVLSLAVVELRESESIDT
jgi:hypothetical protein